MSENRPALTVCQTNTWVSTGAQWDTLSQSHFSSAVTHLISVSYFTRAKLYLSIYIFSLKKGTSILAPQKLAIRFFTISCQFWCKFLKLSLFLAPSSRVEQTSSAGYRSSALLMRAVKCFLWVTVGRHTAKNCTELPPLGGGGALMPAGKHFL